MGMRIEIHIPRPLLTFALIGAISWFLWPSYASHPAQTEAQGGVQPEQVIVESQQSITRERLKQAVLERREEILRYELEKLEEEASQSPQDATHQALSDHRDILLTITKQRKESEELLKQSLEQLWEAQGIDIAVHAPTHHITFNWPVAPTLGLSAHFDDNAYQQRFGIPHHAIDIPTDQGTIIRAPAEGTVTTVKDNGLGYSYVIMDHGRGTLTIYGHVSGFIAKEGDHLEAGDPVAYSGGRPGSPGAGLLTTGPHLHFAVRQDGKLVDPLLYLKKVPGME